MIIESVRVSQKARDQLIWIKRQTGIENWNTVCRWALFTSLAEATRPSREVTHPESNIEMTWKTFAGPHEELIVAMLQERCRQEGLPETPDQIALQFRVHLHRGIRYLFADKSIHSIGALVGFVARDKFKNNSSL